MLIIEILRKLANKLNGKINEVHLLPDGHGFATMSYPLPKDHWIYRDEFEPPPMPFRMGTDNPERKIWRGRVWEAGQYAVRGATMNGTEMDFDPDALLQNLVVGMLGYNTPNGLSKDDWANPQTK